MSTNPRARTLAPATRRRVLAVVFIVLANVFGGAAYPAQKAALQGLPPATVTLLRSLVAVLALFVCLRLRPGVRARWSAADLWRVSALGILAYALPMWLGIVGVQLSSASSASILILLEPITIVAIAWLALGERVGLLKMASLLLGLLGALAIVFEGASLGDLMAGEHFVGNLVLVLHGILWGCHTPIAKPLAQRHDALDLCFRVTWIGSCALVVPAALEWEGWQAGPALYPALAWTLVLGVVVSFGGTLMWLSALREIPASNVAGFVFLQPLAGVLVGIGVLGERLSLEVLAGTSLIVAGVGLDVILTATRGRTPE